MDFTLFNTYINIANKREDDREQHEYYVTAEYNGKIDTSGNVNVSNPNVPKPKSLPTTKPKPTTAKFTTRPNSPKKQSDAKGKILSAEFVDSKGNKISTAKIGTNAIIKITSRNLKDKTVKIKIWEDDPGFDDLLFERNLVIGGDISYYSVPLTKKMYADGESYEVEGNNEEFYIEIEHLSISTESSRINVGLNEEPKKLKNPLSRCVVQQTQVDKGDEICFCKQKDNKFYWNNKLTCKQRKQVLKVCGELWGEDKKSEKASELMSVVHLETAATFDPSKDNGVGYTGLIQFSDASAKSVGTTRSALKKMTFTEQMDFVKKYFNKKKDSLKTMTDLYLLVLKQNAVGQGGNPNYVLFDEGISVPDVKFNKDNLSKEPWVSKYGYSSNPSFMSEKGEYENKRKFQSYSKGLIYRRGFKNGKTYVWEVTDVLTKEHYDLGKTEIFKGKCEDLPEQKNDSQDDRAPWMKIAINLAKEMKGCKEGKEPMYSKAKSYLRYCNNSFEPTDGKNGPWCAAFMNWCIGQCINRSSKTPYLHSKSASSQAPRNNKNYRKISEPIYGAIVIYRASNGTGHTGFLYGKTKDGKYLLVGGNQDDTIRFDAYGEYTSKSKKKKLDGFYIPADYIITDADKLTTSDTYNNADTANVKFGIIASKPAGKTN